MATLTVAAASRTGVDMVGAASAAGGDAFLNTGQEVVQIVNSDSGSHNVTFVTQSTVDGLAVADLVVAVAAGVTKVVGPFPTGIYNDGSGLVQITYSAVTTQTTKVLRVTPA